MPGIDVDGVVHADWGSTPGKRWMCVARRRAGRFEIDTPQPVGEVSTLVARSLELAAGGGALLGFDFPIGLPLAYARRAGIDDFIAALPGFGRGDWGDFYTPAETPAQVDVRRPFYPGRLGGTRQFHLCDGLGVDDMRALLRRCERPTGQRVAASSLFWLVGARQVGRGAIVGWRDLIAPALRDVRADLRVWPFDGDLAEIAAPGRAVIAETYPADACVQLGLPAPGRGWSKRSQADRRLRAPRLLEHVRRRGHRLAPGLGDLFADGFGGGPAGEDAFDALVGLLAMLEVVSGRREAGMPDATQLRRIEGWILGLADPD